MKRLFIFLFAGVLLLGFSSEKGFPQDSGDGSDLDIVVTWSPIIGTKRGQIVSFTYGSKIIRGATVAPGLKFNLEVRKKGKYYLYILKLDSKKRLSVLFPHKSLAQKNPVGKGILSSQFGRKTGEEQYYIFISLKRQSTLEKLIQDLPASGTPLTDRLKKKLKKAQSLRLLTIKYNFDVQSNDYDEYD